MSREICAARGEDVSRDSTDSTKLTAGSPEARCSRMSALIDGTSSGQEVSDTLFTVTNREVTST